MVETGQQGCSNCRSGFGSSSEGLMAVDGRVMDVFAHPPGPFHEGPGIKHKIVLDTN